MKHNTNVPVLHLPCNQCVGLQHFAVIHVMEIYEICIIIHVLATDMFKIY